MRVRPLLVGFCLGVVLGVLPAPLGAQAVLDRIVARVNGRIITQSDVARARLLKLVDDPSSDESARTGLEDRMLILDEVARLSTLAASEQDLAARRTEWEASLGPPGAASLLAQSGTSEGELRSWLRDDVRIRMYVDRQFGQMPQADRAQAIAQWIGRLRQRAGLK